MKQITKLVVLHYIANGNVLLIMLVHYASEPVGFSFLSMNAQVEESLSFLCKLWELNENILLLAKFEESGKVYLASIEEKRVRIIAQSKV